MAAELKKIIIREGPILLGFIVLFLLGRALSGASFGSAFVQILILTGLYGYPLFVIIRYIRRTAKVFKNLDGPAQRRKVSIVLLSVVGLYLVFFIHNYWKKEFMRRQLFGQEEVKKGQEGVSFFTTQSEPPANSGCTITARILSVEEKYYDDLTILRRKHHRRGVTKVFLQLQILGAENIIPSSSGSDTDMSMCEVGQIVDVYAYKETDIIGTQPLRKFDKIKCEIMALPVGSGGFYYKIDRIRRH